MKSVADVVYTYISMTPIFYPALFSARRLALGLSTQELAARCNLTSAMIERLEEGRFLPSPSQAFQLAQALGFDPMALAEWVMTQLLYRRELLAEHVLDRTQSNVS